MMKFLYLLLLLVASFARADITSTATIQNDDSAAGCTISSWAEPLGYTKPFCRTADSSDLPASVYFPAYDEGTIANKYYIDLSSGSGSTCSLAVPCDTFTDLNGKTGINGGPAVIYVKGTGTWANQALVGGASDPIVVKPWDDSTTATITGANQWTTAHQYLFVDGGTNQRIRFSSTGGGQFSPSIYFHESASDTAFQNITFYRTRWHVPGRGVWVMAWSALTNISWINSDLSATGSTENGEQHHIYLSGNGTSGSSTDGNLLSGINVIGCAIYDTPGEAIEMRMADNNSELVDFNVIGNAFHNIGLDTCSGGWKCRGAITLSDEGGGTITGPVQISNNLIWNTGEGAVRMWAGPSTMAVQNNTIYRWGIGTPANGAWGSAAFSNSSFSGSVPGNFRNNIIYATGNDGNGNAKVPFSTGGQGDSNNACATANTTCAASGSQSVSSGSFLSLDEDDPDFLKPTSGASVKDTGTSTSGVCRSPSYWNVERPIGTCDIGAFEQ